ncbi:PAS domain-containing protein [Flavobacterium sp. GCM10023249]|uniref:PAS domain-containing protein n=1 Tax=unclassified Flavobacterium TaxID=196869 RepID=UPI0036197256
MLTSNRLSLHFSNEQFEILLNLYQSSFTSFNSIDQVQEEIVKSVALGLRIPRVGIWKFENDLLKCEKLLLANSKEFIQYEALKKSDIPIYYDLLQKGAPVIASNAFNDFQFAELKDSYLVPLDIQSIMDVPILENGELVGILCCESQGEIKEWNENDIAFARSVADILSLITQAFKRKQSENELIENQKRFNFISENISDGIYIIENDQMVFASKRYYEMIRMSPDEKQDAHQKDMFHLVHPDDYDYVRSFIYGSLAKQLPSFKYVFRLKRGDGTYMWREDIMNVHYNEVGHPFRAVTIARDITQEKEQEFEAEALQETLVVQNNLLLKLYSASEKKSITGKITEIITVAANGLNIDRSSFWVVKGDKLVCRKLYDKIENKYRKEGFFETRNIPKYIAAVNNQMALVADDVYTNEHTAELIDNYLKPLGITDMLDIPIRANGKFYGVLCCEHRNDPRIWNENDISFARALADYLSLALEENKRKKAERKLKESEQQLRLITENTSDGVVVIEKGVVTYCSPSYSKLLNYPKKEYLRFTIEDLFERVHPDDRESVKMKIYDCLSKKLKEFKYEFRFKSADGYYYWREESVNVIYDEDSNKYIKYIIVSRDISKRKEEEKERNRLHRITEKQNEKLINFTHIVSHDIRSHTSNLAMILDLFEESDNPEEQKEYFKMLKQSTNKLSDTIFFLNETVAVQSGISNEKVKLNLRDEIQKAILGISAIIKTSNAELNINVPENLEIEATQSYLESIIFNLLTNAIKYKSKDRSPVINITASKTNDEIKLIIEDNGIGIDLEKNKEKIFGMYKTFHGNPDAVGLGLFMVKNHIESMGGRIEVNSEINKGTTFSLYFI